MILSIIFARLLRAYEKESGQASTANKGESVTVARSIVKSLRAFGRTWAFDVTARCTQAPSSPTTPPAGGEL